MVSSTPKLSIGRSLEAAGIEFIDENGGGKTFGGISERPPRGGFHICL